jgi:Zn-finger nucleic acid-binding protein
MMQTCPKCEDQPLAAVGRGVSKCTNCGGSFVAPGATPGVEVAGTAAGESHDAQGGRCPADRTIMSRTEVFFGHDRPPVHLERCSSCRGIWFDAGEWQALAERELIDHLDELWTAEWRASQRRLRNEQATGERLRETFGPELYGALQDVAARLRGHERRSQALAFLREASSSE